MKFHRTYHPKSWSQQAREFADRIFVQYVAALQVPEEFREVYYGNGVWKTLSTHNREYWVAFFQNSYRHPMIANRAAKRFGRLTRKHEV